MRHMLRRCELSTSTNADADVKSIVLKSKRRKSGSIKMNCRIRWAKNRNWKWTEFDCSVFCFYFSIVNWIKCRFYDGWTAYQISENRFDWMRLILGNTTSTHVKYCIDGDGRNCELRFGTEIGSDRCLGCAGSVSLSVRQFTRDLQSEQPCAMPTLKFKFSFATCSPHVIRCSCQKQNLWINFHINNRFRREIQIVSDCVRCMRNINIQRLFAPWANDTTFLSRAVPYEHHTT